MVKRFFQDLAAALMLFTRLPWWRLFKVPGDSFSRVVNYWSLTGWLTGGITAAALWILALDLPFPVAVILAFGLRVLLTGAMHEDGLSDFFDGFGGGRDRDSILAIMKDSRTGTYGILGMIFYYAAVLGLIASLPVGTAVFVVGAGDPLCKFIASQTVNCLKYSRPVEESKVGAVYTGMGVGNWIFSAAAGLLPAIIFLPPAMLFAALFPCFVLAALLALMYKKIEGYTGDCCGAAFLLCELSFYIGVWVIM